MTGERKAPVPTLCHFGPSLSAFFGLFMIATFIKSSHTLTILSILAPDRRMLAVVTAPHGLVFQPIQAAGYMVEGLLVIIPRGGCPSKILLMGQQVQSGRFPLNNHSSDFTRRTLAVIAINDGH